MTSSHDEPASAGPPAWRRFMKPAVAAILFMLVFLAVRSIVRAFDPFGMGRARAGETTVTQAVVVGKMRTVAQLVTSETTVRDVVTYENRRLGSTKRALVVVTARVLAGIDLDRGTEVAIDHEARQVRIELPAASVLAVEITEMRTWDEQNGILNRFRPADRDTIFAIARRQLAEGAAETGALAHADTSARRLLEALVNADGYATEVVFREADGRATGSDRGVPLR
jgi:hypothetical protein